MKYDGAWFGMLSKSALDGLREYYEKNESLLESAEKDDISRIDHEIATGSKLTEDQKRGEWDIHMQQHDATYDMFFDNFFRYSCIVLVTLVLEDHLHKLCWALFKVKGHPEAPPDPQGDTIATYRKYVSGFNLTYDQSIWDFIHDLKCIRNCIVHSSGDVSRRTARQQSELHTIAEKGIGVHIGAESIQYQLTPLYLDDDMIIIEPRYCQTVIRATILFFETLSKAADFPLEIKFKRRRKSAQ